MLECFMIKSHLNIYGIMIWEEKKGFCWGCVQLEIARPGR